MIVVADACAVGSFLLPDEAGVFADHARRVCATNIVHVPPHWPVEIANIIWKAGRRKRIAAPDMGRIVDMASSMAAVVMVGGHPPLGVLTSLANDLGLTAYDSAYFWQARELRAPLLTIDGALRRVALEQGLDVLLA